MARRVCDPEQKSNAADKAFPLVSIDLTPPRHAVWVPRFQATTNGGTGLSQGTALSGSLSGVPLLRASVGRSCR